MLCGFACMCMDVSTHACTRIPFEPCTIDTNNILHVLTAHNPHRKGASLIRINTLASHAATPSPSFGAKSISLQCGVLHAVHSIDNILERMLQTPKVR